MVFYPILLHKLWKFRPTHSVSIFRRAFGEKIDKHDKPYRVTINFKQSDGTIVPLKAKVGSSILDVSRKYDLGLEGACEGSVACSTCHIYVDGDSYDKLPMATDEENDMLDMAPQLTEYSRLGCQVIVNEDLEGMTVSFPTMTRNFYVDGHKPGHH